MKVSIEITDKNIRQLVLEYLRGKLGDAAKLSLEDIKILVKSKQNYRVHEWETGELSVKYEGEV